MLISDEKRFIFVHVPKAAGTSIRQALRPYANPKNRNRLYSLLRPLGLPRDHRRFRFLTHGSLASAQRVIPAGLFHDYFKFAFVRNPWDRLVSEYNALMQKPGHRRHRRVARLGDFAGYVQHEATRVVRPQTELLADARGEIGVDFVGRFESLEADFAHVCAVLDVDCRLPRLNAREHAGYRTYYDVATRELVARLFASDVDAFGYTF